MGIKYSQGSAASQGISCCRVCAQLNDAGDKQCQHCGEKIFLRAPQSIQKTLALLIASIIFYVPANLYPIMKTSVLGDQIESTIFSGILLFIDSGAYFVASVIFIASIVIPLTKMLAIAWLCQSVISNKPIRHKQLAKLHAMTEFIGKWSMVDVFVVAILVALIQIGSLMVITPGLAAISFSVVVILTMLSAQCFDSRLLWDKAERK